MRKCFIVLLLSLLCVYIARSVRILILGKSGNGKSTITATVFGVSEHVPIGHTKRAETRSVYTYQTSLASRLFPGWYISDTPGFDDTEGLTNDEIVELIEVELSQLHSDETVVDGMILMAGTLNNRDHSALHLATYLSLFGEEMLGNLMVVVNRYDTKLRPDEALKSALELKYHIKSELQRMVANSQYARRESLLTVPVIDVDCKHPGADEIETLKNTLESLQPYKLKNLDKKKERIRELFYAEMKNADNYKNHSENVIEYEEQTVERPELKKNTVPMEESVCGGPSWSVNVGVFSVSGPPSCKSVTKLVPQDEIVTLMHSEKVPVNKENITSVLKNEEEHYWRVAKDKYKEELLLQFTNRKANS